jgi:lysyl-tRNA synthetase class II
MSTRKKKTFLKGTNPTFCYSYSELNDPEEQLKAFKRQVEEGDSESPKSVDWELRIILVFVL